MNASEWALFSVTGSYLNKNRSFSVSILNKKNRIMSKKRCFFYRKKKKFLNSKTNNSEKKRKIKIMYTRILLFELVVNTAEHFLTGIRHIKKSIVILNETKIFYYENRIHSNYSTLSSR